MGKHPTKGRECRYTDNEKLQAMAEELAKDIHTEDDLAELSRALLKVTVERALAAELDHHLGYQKHAPEGRNSGNNRNGSTSKTVQGEAGELEISTPRDRNGTFQPQLIGKGQRRLGKFEGQILSLYAKGMTTRDIAATFQEMYDVEVSHTLISQVTEAVMEEVRAWQHRPLDELYPVVFLDGITVKVHLRGFHNSLRTPKAVVKSSQGQAGGAKDDPCGLGHQSGGVQGAAGPVDRRDRRGQVLDDDPDRAANPWGQGHLHRVRGRAKRFPRGD